MALGFGELAEWLRSGLQIRVHRFDSGTRLQSFQWVMDFLFHGVSVLCSELVLFFSYFRFAAA